MLINFNELI
jgi:hypothetical protein